MRINKKVVLSVAMAGMLTASPLYAQFFSNNVSAQRTEEQAQQKAVSGANQQYAQPDAAQKPVQQYQQQGYNPAYGTQQQGYVAQQKKQQPKAQPAPANYSPIKYVEYKIADNKNNDKELILLYMKNFKVYRSASGQTRCSMLFAISTTLKDKITNISYRLKWPNMETVLSFNDVPPQVENHFNYTLLGDGCYSMDKTPNIIINRCRAKGLSQRTCADKVRWVTRAS